MGSSLTLKSPPWLPLVSPLPRSPSPRPGASLTMAWQRTWPPSLPASQHKPSSLRSTQSSSGKTPDQSPSVHSTKKSTTRATSELARSLARPRRLVPSGSSSRNLGSARGSGSGAARASAKSRSDLSPRMHHTEWLVLAVRLEGPMSCGTASHFYIFTSLVIATELPYALPSSSRILSYPKLLSHVFRAVSFQRVRDARVRNTFAYSRVVPVCSISNRRWPASNSPMLEISLNLEILTFL